MHRCARCRRCRRRRNATSSAFALPVDDLADRSSIVLTLLLTAVAFKLVISDSIPKVSYFTVMDFYMNGMFILLFIISVENGLGAAVHRVYPDFLDAYMTTVDAVTFGSVLLVWLGFHVWFLRKCTRAMADSREQLKGTQRVSAAASQSQSMGLATEVRPGIDRAFVSAEPHCAQERQLL